MQLSELETMRSKVIQEFDYWAANGLGEEITTVQINVRTYRKPGQQVRSLGMRDPQHEENGIDAPFRMALT